MPEALDQPGVPRPPGRAQGQPTLQVAGEQGTWARPRASTPGGLCRAHAWHSTWIRVRSQHIDRGRGNPQFS